MSTFTDFDRAVDLIHEQTCRDNRHAGPEESWPCKELASAIAAMQAPVTVATVGELYEVVLDGSRAVKGADKRTWFVWESDDGELLASSYPDEDASPEDDWRGWGRVDAESLSYPLTLLHEHPAPEPDAETVERYRSLVHDANEWAEDVKREAAYPGESNAADDAIADLASALACCLAALTQGEKS